MNSYFIDTEVFLIPEGDKRDGLADTKSDMLVLCHESDYNAHSALLVNILKAVGYQENDNAQIIKLDEDEQLSLAPLASECVSRVMCFGLKPRQISMNAGFHANQFYHTESFSILLTHSLAQLDSQTKFKKALWTALQEHFKAE